MLPTATPQVGASSQISPRRIVYPFVADSTMSVHRSACDVDDLPRDEPGVGAHEERRGVRDVLGLTDSADRDGPRRDALMFSEVAAEPASRCPGHVSDDESRRDGVGGDPVPSELERE